MVLDQMKEMKKELLSGQTRSSHAIKPLIVYSYEPEVIHTDPSNFMRIVQSLTGSSSTTGNLSSSPKSPATVSTASSSSPSSSSSSSSSSPAAQSPSSSSTKVMTLLPISSSTMASMPISSSSSSSILASSSSSAITTSSSLLPTSSSTTISAKYSLLNSSSLSEPFLSASRSSHKKRKLKCHNVSKKKHELVDGFTSNILISDDEQELLISPKNPMDASSGDNIDHEITRKAARLTTNPSLKSSDTEQIHQIHHALTSSSSRSESSITSLSSILSSDPIMESSMSSNSWSTCLLHPDDFCESDLDPQVYQEPLDINSSYFDHHKETQKLPRASQNNSFAIDFLDDDIDLFGDVLYDASIAGSP